MARRMIVVTTCDLCGTDQGTTALRLPDPRGRERELDLCPTDWDALGIPRLFQALADLGHDPAPEGQRVAPTADARAHGDHWCIVCDKRLSTGPGIFLHQAREHGLGHPKRSAAAGDVYGPHATTCPLCAETRTSAQGVMRHATTAHADVLPADPSVHTLWWAAHRAGDPHGLVALVRKEHGATAQVLNGGAP
jgi:hypothetical protein